MFRTFLIPILAIVGVVFGVWTVVKGSKPPPTAPPVIEPPVAPYESFVAGSGLIEANTQNIAVGATVAGVVTEVAVVVGQDVKAGDVLFTIDDREQVAELHSREALLHIQEEQLARLNAQPRVEEIPPSEARVREAEAALADAQSQLDLWQKVNDPRAISQDELSKRRYAVKAAEARLVQAQTNLVLLKAGAWASDKSVAEAQVQSARAQVEAARVDVERRVVRAPVTGRVLQVNIRLGEYAPAGAMTTPLMMLGGVKPLHVRVDIDEHDAWRVKADAPATAFVRGNKSLRASLTFVRFEPYVVPKRALTGESTERVDTRVLQVIFSFDPGNMPVFVGQQMDVYIEASPVDAIEPGNMNESKSQKPTDRPVAVPSTGQSS